MPGVQNWQTSPLHFIDETFSHHNQALAGAQLTTERLKQLFDHVSNFFQDKFQPEKWPSIPSLNDAPIEELYDGQIVRFRGMIQDVCEAEMYLARYEVRDLKTGTIRVETGRYRETTNFGRRDELVTDPSKTVKMERRPFILVSVPGETEWVKDEYKQFGSGRVNSIPKETGLSNNAIKRSFVDDGQMDVDQVLLPKRCKTDEKETSSSSCDAMDVGGAEMVNFQQSRIATDDNENCKNVDDCDTTTVVAKIYDSPDDVNLNDVVEVIGVISLENSDDGAFFQSPLKIAKSSSNSGSNFVPKIAHVHVIKLIQLIHTNPLLPVEMSMSYKTEMMQEAKLFRYTLHRLLSKALFGDHLSADYLLFHLISKIYVRRDRLCLGKLSINMFNLPTGCNFGKLLCKFLQSLLSKAVYFPVTLESLNETSLMPQTDSHGVRLVGGPLQLSCNTHLLLDETELRERHLSATGRENVTFLRKLIDLQKVEYGHRADHLECPVDVPCLILSHNSSILSSDVQVLVEPKGAHPPPTDVASIEAHFKDLDLDLDQLNLRPKLRQYLTLAQQSKYEVPPEMQKFIQSEIVRTRRLRRENSLASDELHTLLVLSRFLILTRGETDLTKDAWEEAKCLEARRKARFDRPGRIL